MDILDLDEELKNDTFFASEDKTHDDVLNILQQWKNNWGTLQDKEQAYATNSKTFVRPKKKIPQPSQLQNTPRYSINQNDYRQDAEGLVNLEIGGYVTNMHKSFLQDTSPPNSICSFIDNCNDQINNSLITSGDFTNISFLRQSLNCSDSIECIINNPVDNKSAKLTETTSSSLGDSFNGMLRDRKPLDSLTLSADGTLIKDCNIGQIDDISLALSKTASSCSTMNNSTNSNDSSPNIYNDESADKNNTFNYYPAGAGAKTQKSNLTTNIDMISNTSINLVNSFVCKDSNVEENYLNSTQTIASCGIPNQTFRKAALPLDETICMLPTGAANSTFDMVVQEVQSGSRCETPENINKTGNFCISTPHVGNVGPKKQQFTPHLDKTEEMNLSPIVGGQIKVLNETFESDPNKTQKKKIDLSYGGGSGGGGITMDNKYNNNYANNFNKNYQCFNDEGNSDSNDPNCPNILELANAEAALLASNGDELQFEHMLEELSKIHTSYDQSKLKISLNSIKKRLNCANDSIKNENASETATILETHSRGGGGADFNKTKNLSDTINKENSIGGNSPSPSTNDRLLNRRSRLYDNINLSMLPDNKSNSIELEHVEDNRTKTNGLNESGSGRGDENVSNVSHNEIPENTQNTQLTRRERDRDRFKTIKISSTRNEMNSNVKNLPCIDNDGSVITNNYGTEHESIKTTNFQTYKDLKDEPKLKVENKIVSSESVPVTTTQASNIRAPVQQRSLSRPRYISGLQKFSAICKATSAGDLDTNSSIAANAPNENLTKFQANASVVGVEHNQGVLTKEMKSPMGIKSKSFHNLSFQSGSNLAGTSQMKTMQSRLMRPRTKTYQSINAERMQQVQTQKSSDVFKVPRAVVKPSNIKPASLPRPLSGCYSGSQPAKSVINNSDLRIDQKPDSSKEKLISLDSTINVSSQKNVNQGTDSTNQVLSKQLKSSAGIPKPSGIRPPTVKRSCLPRPSSITRH